MYKKEMNPKGKGKGTLIFMMIMITHGLIIKIKTIMTICVQKFPSMSRESNKSYY